MTNKWVLEQARLEALGKLAAVEAQRDVLLGVAKSLVSSDYEARCPWCARFASEGHAPNCERQAALAKVKEDSA